jgi:hypothetical protein
MLPPEREIHRILFGANYVRGFARKNNSTTRAELFYLMRCGAGGLCLVSSADMPNPNPKTETELLEQAKHLAGELSDQRTITLFCDLLIADAIRFDSGRMT